MIEEIKSWLIDIDTTIGEIDSFLPAKRDFSEFRKDLKTKRAIERNIAIIGEAMSRTLKKDPSIKITNSRKIVDTRNRIIHGYDKISDEILWGIVNKSLPILKKKLIN